jgi:hypothetical protein
MKIFYVVKGGDVINEAKKLSGLKNFVGTRSTAIRSVLPGGETFSPKNVKILPFEHPKKNVRKGLF